MTAVRAPPRNVEIKPVDSKRATPGEKLKSLRAEIARMELANLGLRDSNSVFLEKPKSWVDMHKAAAAFTLFVENRMGGPTLSTC